ncbi:MAG TPA: ATP-grasp domain-containing protein, partial [Acidimicrobiales bacterium]|nr:ATP-grasp domain-containing protein [Acidimicrobiales bacterium]
MDLLEYQGKQLLAAHGAPVPEGRVADTVDAAGSAAEALGYPVVLKAQVPVGGRGKAGAIRVAATPEEVHDHAAAILGLSLQGHPVRRLWLEPASDIAHEHYASLTFDRAARRHLLLVSARGGIDIEQVAREDSEAVVRHHVDPLDDLSAEAARDVIDRAGLDPAAAAELSALLLAMWSAYRGGDAELVEVNPLVVTAGGRVVALDAKVILDDSAAFRHPEWSQWRAEELLDDRERLAREKGLNYIGLAGSVGVIGNGAGVVMSTLDVVNQVGGTAANFLDIGG